MYPDRGIFRMDRCSYGISTRLDNPNSLTHQYSGVWMMPPGIRATPPLHGIPPIHGLIYAKSTYTSTTSASFMMTKYLRELCR